MPVGSLARYGSICCKCEENVDRIMSSTTRYERLALLQPCGVPMAAWKARWGFDDLLVK